MTKKSSAYYVAKFLTLFTYVVMVLVPITMVIVFLFFDERIPYDGKGGFLLGVFATALTYVWAVSLQAHVERIEAWFERQLRWEQHRKK